MIVSACKFSLTMRKIFTRGLPLGMLLKTRTEIEDVERITSDSGASVFRFTRRPVQLFLLVLAVGATGFVGAVLLLSVMLCLFGRKDDVWRVANRVFRRKQGQDKE